MVIVMLCAITFMVLMVLKAIESAYSLIKINPIQLQVSKLYLAQLECIQMTMDDNTEQMRKDHEKYVS